MIRVFFCRFSRLLIVLAGFAIGIPACEKQVELADVCSPNTREVCYDGPLETVGIGRCRGGLRTCREDGSGFGPCEGAVLPAPEVCGVGADEDCNGKTDECTGDVLWAKRWYDVGFPRSMSADGLGNVVIGIEFASTLDLAGAVGAIGSTNEYGASGVVKVNANGKTEFAQVVDGGLWVQMVSADKIGNIFAAGNFQDSITLAGETFHPNATRDILFFGLNPAGDVKLRRHFMSLSDCIAGAIDSSPQGEVILTGTCSFSSLDLGSGKSVSDTFLIRFSPTGNIVYATEFSLASIDGALFDGQGNIVLSGWFYDQANFGGQTLESPGKESSFVAKLGPAGEHLWSQQVGGANVDYVYINVQPDLMGNVYVAATFQGIIDFGGGPIHSLSPAHGGDAFLMKLDPKGNYLWGKHFGNGSSQQIRALTVDASGNVIIAGTFNDKIDFGAGTLYAAAADASDIAIAKFTPEGKAVWSRRFGVGSNIHAPVIAAGPLGEIFFAGTVIGDIDFGTGPLAAKSYVEDTFVVKLAP